MSRVLRNRAGAGEKKGKTVDQENRRRRLVDRVRGRVLYPAVVQEYFSNPQTDLSKKFDDDTTLGQRLSKGSSRVTNANLLSKMPRKSIAATVISEGEGWDNPDEDKPRAEIFYPLFPHLTLPVKPGEQVWVVYEMLARKRASKGYWIGRIANDIKVEDPNYSHKEREGLYSAALHGSGQQTSQISMHTGEEDDTTPPESALYGFRGGGMTAKSSAMPNGNEVYDIICGESLSYVDQFQGEPVPRWSPRTGDLCLEGSNNTLISMGLHRVDGEGPDSPKSADGIPENSGTIDIVTGRGQP